MSKKTLIIIGSIIIIALLIVWGYVLFVKNDNIENSNNQANFPDSGVADISTNDLKKEMEEQVEETKQRLTHVTTKRIVGFSEIIAPIVAKLPLIYYVEQGTGHVFSYDPETKEEKRISGTTLNNIDRAVISPKGDYIAFSKKSNNKNHPFTLGEINQKEGNITTFDFSKEVDDFEFDVEGNNLFYSTRGEFGLEGYSYNLANNTHKKLFSLPFFEATVIWGKAVTDPIYAYPKPASLLEGAMYEIKSNTITRLPASGSGLFGLANSKVIAYSFYNQKDRTENSILLNRADGSKKGISIPFFPEKCLIAKSVYTLFCAVDETQSPNLTLPDSWYRGEIGFSDSVLQIDETGTTVVVSNLEDLSGQKIDISRLNLGFSERFLYFTNKKDNSLWMYEI